MRPNHSTKIGYVTGSGGDSIIGASVKSIGQFIMPSALLAMIEWVFDHLSCSPSTEPMHGVMRC